MNDSMTRIFQSDYKIGNARVVQLLLEHGAEVNTKYNDTHYAMSPLHFAAMKGNVEVVRVLREHGASINNTDYEERTPLHVAAIYGHMDVVEFLFKNDAEIIYYMFVDPNLET